jgi:rubrerythrin
MKRAMGAWAVLCLAGAVAWAGEAANATLDNVKAAYQGGLDAKARYEAFAAKADEEGYKSVAALFRAAASSEGVCIAKHQAALKKLGAEAKAEAAKPEVKSTKENLAQTVKDKTAAKDTTLPAYIKQAEADKQDQSVMAFKGAAASEAEQVKFCQQALDNLDAWKAGDKEFLVCQVCSYVSMDTTLKQCPICSAPRSKFKSFK